MIQSETDPSDLSSVLKRERESLKSSHKKEMEKKVHFYVLKSMFNPFTDKTGENNDIFIYVFMYIKVLLESPVQVNRSIF